MTFGFFCVFCWWQRDMNEALKKRTQQKLKKLNDSMAMDVYLRSAIRMRNRLYNTLIGTAFESATKATNPCGRILTCDCYSLWRWNLLFFFILLVRRSGCFILILRFSFKSCRTKPNTLHSFFLLYPPCNISESRECSIQFELKNVIDCECVLY